MTDINFLGIFQGLRKNVINKCLYSHNEIVDFYECTGEILEKHSITSINDPWNSAQLSTVVGHQRSHDDEYIKKHGKIVKKQCITLENIIIENNLPNTIDYLSIDIENCEEEVFRVFPWDKYIFKTISLEEGHKHAAFLKSKGYQMVDNPYQVYKPWIDYFFVHESMIESYPYKILDHNDFIYGYPLDDDRY